jgi:hypothetical protein
MGFHGFDPWKRRLQYFRRDYKLAQRDGLLEVTPSQGTTAGGPSQLLLDPTLHLMNV